MYSLRRIESAVTGVTGLLRVTRASRAVTALSRLCFASGRGRYSYLVVAPQPLFMLQTRKPNVAVPGDVAASLVATTTKSLVGAIAKSGLSPKG